MMATTKKKPTPAQLEARRLFAERSKCGAFDKGNSKKAKGKSVKAKRPASPAQLRARAAFTKMVKDRAKKRKNARGFSSLGPSWLPGAKKKTRRRKKSGGGLFGFGKKTAHVGASSSKGAISFKVSARTKGGLRRKKRRAEKAIGKLLFNPAEWAAARRLAKKANPGKIRFSEADLAKYAGKIKGLSVPSSQIRSSTSRRPKKGKSFKKVGVFGGKGFLGLGRSTQRLRVNTSKRATRERKITRAKRQQILQFKQHGIRRPQRRTGPGRLPNPLLRSVEPTLFSKKGRRTPGHFETSFGKGRKARKRAASRGVKDYFGGGLDRSIRAGFAARSGARSSRLPNPSPAKVFTEFRGKDATTKTKVKAAKGTPAVLAKLGELRELKLKGRASPLKFGGSAALAADGRKKLHVVGVQMARPNPPGEVDYGEIESVTYRADKPHIESGTFDYLHHFGEDGGRKPHLIVDEEGMPLIEGGSYRISSDGIID